MAKNGGDRSASSTALVSIHACSEVKAVRQMHTDLIEGFFAGNHSVRDFVDQQADRLYEQHAQANPATVTHLKSWSPTFLGRPSDEIAAAELTRCEARETMAREYGFDGWQSLAEEPTILPDLQFERTVEAVIGGDLSRLEAALSADPRLVDQRSCFGHQSTLLHYVAANGVETFRQQVPSNAVAVAQLLLNAGADPNSRATMYGGADVLGLLLSSAHPAEAGVTPAVAAVLRAAINPSARQL